MKRIEAIDLKPGDTFEYERTSRYARPQTQVKRDTVKPLTDGTWRRVAFVDRVGERGARRPVEDGMTIYTEDGETHHHYVNFRDVKTVVVLFEEGDL